MTLPVSLFSTECVNSFLIRRFRYLSCDLEVGGELHKNTLSFKSLWSS